jgi:hypothetical protein
MPSSWGASEIITSVSAFIAFCAMGVALWAAKEAKRQADAALGEVEPLIFLDSVAFENPQSVGGRAALTIVNHNRRDIRLIEIEIKTDPAILVTVSTGEMRDVIAAAYQHSRKGEDGPLKIDLREKHHLIRGSSIGMAGSRCCIPLHLTRIGDRNFTQEIAALTAVVRYVLLDARHGARQVEAFATVPYRHDR